MGRLTGVRVVGRLMTVLVLGASGVYVVLYLYRWEWNRALMAGVFFLAAELALVASATNTRLRALEQRLGPAEGAREPGDGTPGPGTGRDARAAKGPFAWLDETAGGFGVFIPILLGAGVILSLVAWAVERLARFVTAPAAGGAHLSALAPLDLPTDGLVPPPGTGVDGAHDPERLAAGRRPPREVLHLVVTVVAIMGLVTGVWFLRESAESRPGTGKTGTTTVQLEVSTRETGSTTAQIIDALWISCRLRLPSDATLLSASAIEDGAGEIVMSPALGRTEGRKFTGCLEDAVIDRVNADVTRFETDPVRPR